MVTAKVSLVAAGMMLTAVVVGAEADDPELDFLEYLGMWDESDEDWQLFAEEAVAENEERSDAAPEGEESTEKEDDS